MPIGGRNPAPSRSQVYPGGTPATMVDNGGGLAAGSAAGGSCGCSEPRTERRWATITATARDCTPLGFGPLSLPVAELPASGQDQCYVLERVVVDNGAAAGSILVITGDIGSTSLVDFAVTGGALFLVSADAHPIVLPPGTPALFVWLGVSPSQAGLCKARLQIRVDPA